jgi:DNA-3-methyladenine glycosylase II
MHRKTLYTATSNHFDFGSCLQFLDRGYAECLYAVTDTSVIRLIRLESGLALIEVSGAENQLIVEISKDSIDQQDETQCLAYVRDWFDLDRDISAFYQLLGQQTETKKFAEKYAGLRLMGIVDLFEALCWCVIGQQINLTFAHKIKTRLVNRYGDVIEHKGQALYCFPTPQQLANIERDELVAMQFSKQKINYIINISQAFCEDVLNKKHMLNLDKKAQMEKLLAIKGIGPWTANYVSMKSLRDMTCIAYGDTGLSSALHTHFNTEKKPDKITIDKIFKSFAGWESYLNFYLWRSLS